jgi:hypothetical protein
MPSFNNLPIAWEVETFIIGLHSSKVKPLEADAHSSSKEFISLGLFQIS